MDGSALLPSVGAVPGHPTEILLVEDHPGDVRLTQEALRDAAIHCHLSVVSDGDVALAFLRRERGYAAAPRPALVLLDLGLPRVDGREVLCAMRADPALRAIPVAILTGSPDHRARVEAEGLPAQHLFAKPLAAAQLRRLGL
jgi:CheY-like chemotaxis protein